MTAEVLHLPRPAGSPIPPRHERDWVTTQELVDEGRITYRQADYWTRTGLLVPLEAALPGSGYMRRFPERELARVRVIHALLDAGLSLVRIRQVVDEVLEHGHVEIGGITIALPTPTYSPKETA
ncbi:MAG TPA: MerR family transcriptional regulator [Acidimicrobiales bacterium]